MTILFAVWQITSLRNQKKTKNCIEVCMKIVISTTVSMPIYEQIINQIRGCSGKR